MTFNRNIIRLGDKVLFVLGTAQSDIDNYQDLMYSHIGINLSDGKVDEVSYHTSSEIQPTIVSISDLSTQQQKELQSALHYSLVLSDSVIAISGKARSGKDTVAKI